MYNKRIVTILTAVLFIAVTTFGNDQQKPLMKDFIGLNVHFKFKPELYKDTCDLIRNYHNICWDVHQPGDPITFPVCANKVNWDTNAYGKWKKSGFEIDLCAQFGNFGEKNKNYTSLWQGQEEWFNRYGYQMAKYFGPSGRRKLVTSVEIGNEPGNDFNDKLYQKLFIAMARGIRKADPKMKIVTATAQAGASDKYSKSLEESFSSNEIKSLYDVINLHVYAVKPKQKGRSPWDRSYPEDPCLEYLKTVDKAIAWRDKNARDKKIWITEFGYDSCTPEAMKKRSGWAKKLNWQGVSDLQQAQYIVRSLFCFYERSINRAYIYFYNDEDKASVHASSGLTRDFKPKPSFWAIQHLYKTLGEYRMNRIILKQKGHIYAYEFTHGSNNNLVIWVVWSPTGSNRVLNTILENTPGKLVNAELMPIQKGNAKKVSCQTTGRNAIKLTVTESPTYLFFDKNR